MSERRCDNPSCRRAAAHRSPHGDLCSACYQYARAHAGAMRPAEVIRASARRHLMIEIRRRRERDLAAVGMVEQYPEPRIVSEAQRCSRCGRDIKDRALHDRLHNAADDITELEAKP